MKKNIKLLITFIVYYRAVVKQYHYMTHLLSYSNNVIQLLQDPLLCGYVGGVDALVFQHYTYGINVRHMRNIRKYN